MTSFLEERQAKIKLSQATQKRKTEQYFNKRVKAMTFKVGDIILKKLGHDDQEEEAWSHMKRIIPSCGE